MSYVVEVETGTAYTGEAFIETKQAVVKWKGDRPMVAWRGKTYAAASAPIGSMKGAATKARNRWQAYFDRTGARFEVEQADKRIAAEAAKKRESAVRRAKMAEAESLYEAAARIIRETDRGGTGDAAISQLRAAVAATDAKIAEALT